MELLKPKSRAPDCNKLTWLEIEIQSQTSAWSAVNLQYGHMVLVRGQKNKQLFPSLLVNQGCINLSTYQLKYDMLCNVFNVVLEHSTHAHKSCCQPCLIMKKKMHVSLFLCMRFCSYSTVMVLCLAALWVAQAPL